MPDISQSILDKLKIKSRSLNTSNQLILQLFCQEEFLRRLEHSDYSQNLVLKGGLLLYCITGFQSRPTQDIDFLVRNISNSEDSISKVIKNVIHAESGSSVVSFELNRLEQIAEHRQYNGLRAKIIARIKNTRIPFDIDMGIDDIVVPAPTIMSVPTQLPGFESPKIYAYSMESTIAEKFDAIISRLELSSRMKDYYDIYYLALTYSFNGQLLQEAIHKTLQKRGTSFDTSTLAVIKSFSVNTEMLEKWVHFASSTLKLSIGFSDVIDVIVRFIGPAFDANLQNEILLLDWNPQNLSYITTE